MSEYHNVTMPYMAASLLSQTPIHTGEWQSKDISKIPQMSTYEIQDVMMRFDVPQRQEDWAQYLGDDLNLSWAEEHFGERVGGAPLNPPPSHVAWPWYRHNGNHQDSTAQFSHTYPERMWPRFAGKPTIGDAGGDHVQVNRGIRFEYGDLQDVVNLLVRSPLTRQAYLPVWFPEDTGAAHKQRVPCTLGYHFMIRNGELSCRYYMRSCDLIRHFTDDVYMAGRLMQWMVEQINWKTHGGSYMEGITREYLKLQPGQMVMYIANLHAFTGDKYKLDQIVTRSVDA